MGYANYMRLNTSVTVIRKNPQFSRGLVDGSELEGSNLESVLNCTAFTILNCNNYSSKIVRIRGRGRKYYSAIIRASIYIVECVYNASPTFNRNRNGQTISVRVRKII